MRIFTVTILLLIVLLPLLKIILVKYFFQQKTIKTGDALRHIGFRGEKPSEILFNNVFKDNDNLSIRKYHEWYYSIQNSEDRISAVLGIDSYRNIEFVGLSFISDYSYSFKFLEKSPSSSNEFSGYVKSLHYGTSIDNAFYFWCPDYRRLHSMNFPIICDVRLSCFPFFVHRFATKKELKEYHLTVTFNKAEPLVGVLTDMDSGLVSLWPYSNKDDDLAKAQTYLCGKVLDIQKRRNSYTGHKFYQVTIDTGAVIVDLVAKRTSFWMVPKVGEYVATHGFLVGHMESMYELEEPDYFQEV